MIKISVIMTVFNSFDRIEHALDSVVNQTIDDIEIICIIDSSTNITEKYSEEYPFIKIIKREKDADAISLNNAIREAKGEYIAFLDADDIYLHEDVLEKIHDMASRNDADMIIADYRIINSQGQIEEFSGSDEMQLTSFTGEGFIDANEYGIPVALNKNVYRKDFIIKNNIDFPNLKTGYDSVFLAKILTRIGKVFVANLDFYGYYRSLFNHKRTDLNSYNIKRDYIKHYILVLDILNNEHFEKAYKDYKMCLVKYLNDKEKIDDTDLIQIVSQLFDNNDYFQENDYGYVIIDFLRNYPSKNDDEYTFMKYCLFEESILENTFIETERLKDFIKISENNDINHVKLSFRQVKEIEDYACLEKERVNENIEELETDIENLINENYQIITSRSWKLSGILKSLLGKSGDNND